MLGAKRIQTEIPGPKSRELMERRRASVSSGVGIAAPIFIEEARGALLTDVDGNTFIDFAGGIGVMNAGHSDPRVVEAIKDQAERFTHTCFYVAHYDSYVELAEKLNALTPGDFEKRTAFFNSGAEAVENAVKIARYHTGRSAVLCFENAFHGRTLLTMTLTSKVMPYKKGFGPFAPEVYRVPAPYLYRFPASVDEYFEVVERAMVGMVDADDLAAVIVEPVSGEGGFIPFPEEYLRRLREFCDRVGALLIADEVQTGFGRTGKMFAMEHSGVVPDLVTTAKSLAGGMPLSAVTGRAEVMDSVHAGGLGTTYGGNPVACAAALAVLRTFEEDGLLERAERLGERIQGAMRDIQRKHPEVVGDVRGLGPMAAMELVEDSGSKKPAKDLTAAIVANALQEGLVLITAGQYGNVIRTLAPLSISDEQLEEGLEILDRAVAAATG
jgi:4-aminobutyrate aminotransferase/(S)-3-amino-2-methylpropionate transaminase